MAEMISLVPPESNLSTEHPSFMHMEDTTCGLCSVYRGEKCLSESLDSDQSEYDLRQLPDMRSPGPVAVAVGPQGWAMEVGIPNQRGAWISMGKRRPFQIVQIRLHRYISYIILYYIILYYIIIL